MKFHGVTETNRQVSVTRNSKALCVKRATN